MSPGPGRTRRAACTRRIWRRARCLWGSTGSATAGWRRGWRSQGWRMSTGWPRASRCCCTSSARPRGQEPRLKTFIDGIRAAGTVSYRAFATARELERLLADDLAVLLSESFAGAAAGAAGPPASPAGPGEPGGAELPAGTVTFLLTDIEGSTRLWETVPGAMAVALERHNRLVTGAIEDHGGVVVTSRGRVTV